MQKRTNIKPHLQKSERLLFHIPIIHTQADMGALSESVRRETLKKVGQRSLKQKIQLIDQIWSQIEQAIDGLDLNYAALRLYQDGLPVCGREVEIVTDLAQNGSRNHQLLKRLMERGAVLTGTESPELLVQEYNLIKQKMQSSNTPGTGPSAKRTKQLSADLLRMRDQYIAGRINTTLLKGQSGLVFLGMLHFLEDWLAKDMRVVYPVSRPLSSYK